MSISGRENVWGEYVQGECLASNYTNCHAGKVYIHTSPVYSDSEIMCCFN